MSAEALSSTPEQSIEPPEIIALREHAQETADNDQRLVLLPYDTVEYPGQALDTRFVESTSILGPTKLIEFSGLVDRRISKLIESVGINQAKVVKNTADLLIEDKNIIALTNHHDILDVAYALVALHVNLQKTKELGEFKSSIIIGKMVAHLGYAFGPDEFMPLVDVLGLFCDRIYLSYPDTVSTKNYDMDPKLISAHNGGMIKELTSNQEEGHHLLAVAGTGTTRGGTIGNGTASLISANNCLVLPIGVSLPKEGDVSLVFTRDRPYKIDGEAQALQAMNDIAEKLEEAA